jgi:excisionase family DNA binding protein
MTVTVKKNPPPEPLLFNAREAARLISVSPRTLWTLANSGQLPQIKVGRRGVRFALADLKKFIDRQRCGGET